MLEKTIAYIPSIAGILAVSSIVLIRNSNNKLNRLFFLLNITVSIWLGLLFAADTTSSGPRALLLVKAAIASTTVIAPLFVFFSYNFPSEKKLSGFKNYLITVPMAILFIASFTSAMVPSVDITESGAHLRQSTPLYSFYSLLTLLYFVAGAIILLRKKKHARPDQRQQINLVLLGVMIGFFVNLVTGYVLAIIDVQGKSNLIGSFSLLAFSILTSYAIVKHRLFDIRLVVARSLAYVLLLATLAAVFAGSLLLLTSVFFKNQELSLELRATYLAVALVTAFIFQPLKRFFDRVTNRIFYRDAYDSQFLLNELNRSLIKTVDINSLLKESARLIGSTLKAEFCYFVINEGSSTPLRFIGYSPQNPHGEQMQEILKEAGAERAKIFVTDSLVSGSKLHLKEMLQQQAIAVFAKIEGKTGRHTSRPAYVVLGQKQSGSPYSSQDVQVLEIIVNELVIAIQNAMSFEEIQRFNETLQDKIDDATKQLRHANSRLKQLDQTKDEFISMASHQLRTPLTTIKGYLSMVLEGDVGPVNKNEKQMIQQAFDSAERMVFLIGDLLNVSRLQSGKFVIDNKPTDLIKMVKTEVEQLKDTAEHHGLKLICNTPDKLPMFSLDETKIRQVVMNFMDNAIYYTPSGGSITVNLEATPDTISYTVVDTGLGVPKEEQHHLFTKFYRAGNARKMRPDGTGLGLFMAKKVVVAQGGAIIFKSEEGKGSTFGFSFPRHKIEIKGKPPEKQPAAAVAA